MNKKKKEEILKVSETLFNRFGTRKTAVDEIARMANVAKGTIYNYFGNKEGIIQEILRSRVSSFEEFVEWSLSGTKDPYNKLKTAITGRFKLIMDTPFLIDRLLNQDDWRIMQVFDDLDRHIKKAVNSILDSLSSKSITQFEKKRILNTIIFTIRGIEDSIKKSMEDISMDNIEKDIEYLLRSLFSKHIPAT